jgi:hypothetical protein
MDKLIIVRKCALQGCRHNEIGWCNVGRVRVDDKGKCMDYDPYAKPDAVDWANRVWKGEK